MATRYKAPHAVQVAGVYYEAGEPFVWAPREIEDKDGKKTETKPGADWVEVSDKEAAVLASADPVPDDADLEALTKAPLQAVAFMRHVQGIADMDADDLKTAIRASYEPKL